MRWESSPAGSYLFTHDPQGTLTSVSTPSGKFYYSFSGIQLGLGPNPGALSIAAVTDSTGSVQASYINCPSGNNIVQSGTAPNSWHTQSAYYDSTTGAQLYFGNGIYDSTIARLTQRTASLLLGARLRGGGFSCGPEQLGPQSTDAAALTGDLTALSLSLASLPESGPLGVAGALIAGGRTVVDTYSLASDVIGGYAPPLLVNDSIAAVADATAFGLTVASLPISGPLAPLDAAAVALAGGSLVYSAGKLAYDVAVTTGT